MVAVVYGRSAGAGKMQIKELTFVRNLEATEEVTVISDVDGNDGFRYGMLHARNPVTGAEYIFIIKYTSIGYVKSIMRLPIGIARDFAKAILEHVK